MKQKHWLERPTTIRWLWIVFIVILVATVALQILIPIHGYFGIDDTFGFNAWYGFVTCIAMIAVAKALGVFLKREDTYYSDDDA